VVVGRLVRDIAAGESVVRVKLLGKVRSKLKRVKTVKVRIVAKITDAAGEVRAETLRLALKRAVSSWLERGTERARPSLMAPSGRGPRPT
jgi:hypothetical protein